MIYPVTELKIRPLFVQDLGILRAIPGITVVVPADAGQVSEAVKAVAYTEGPAYVRIGSGRDPVVFEEPMGFELGKARVVQSGGSDVALFGNGSILPRVFEAAAELSKKGFKATVVEVHTLKPLDVETITSVLSKTGAAVTVEDHNIIGGLGSAIAETSAEEMPVPLVRIGLRDTYPRSGQPEELLDYYQMGVSDIVAAAQKVIDKKSAR